MDRIALKKKFNLLCVAEHQYFLNGSLKPDSIILFHAYREWQVFYLDEKGGKNDKEVFRCEEMACLYIYQLFTEAKKIEKQFGINKEDSGSQNILFDLRNCKLVVDGNV